METLQSLFQQSLRMRWAEYVDIALVAFLIYKLLPLVRNPSTMRIVRAILGVVIVAWGAEMLQLLFHELCHGVVSLYVVT